MIPENERIEFEDRTYVNPEVSLQEQTAFIDNLRNVQNQNNAEINAQTTNLGAYPATQSNLGGLGGGESYFTSRYQVPQGVALANNLRATAQAQALNDILSNEQAMMKQRYTNTQRAARARARANSGGGGGGGNSGGNSGDNTSGWDGEVDVIEGGGGGSGGNKKVMDQVQNFMNKTGLTVNSWQNNATPPNPNDYYIDGAEQTKRASERSGLPEWMVNVLKTMG